MNVKKTRTAYLEEWEEATGVFRGIKSENLTVSVLFNEFRVPFLAESEEAKIAKERLNSALIDQIIALLKTDIPNKPLLVRLHMNVKDKKKK
jgi:hypothetical protein